MKLGVGVRALIIAPLLVVGSILAVSCVGGPHGDGRTTAAPGELLEPSLWTGGPLVATHYGRVLGDAGPNDTWLWRAIPYAVPPVGAARWRAPEPPAPWGGVRHATSFNAGCTQFSPVFRWSITGSEDCLYLNIWRPRDGKTGLPVYVWIHGGGNSMGSATLVPDYYGDRVASRSGMVFVSLNYRLGPFGWFTHPALRDGASALDASGNFGTLDIIQALRWIQGNIAAFGGDPRRVLLTGESAGAMDVLSLMISPLAAGLFQRAMSQSGAASTQSIAAADEKSQRLLEKLLVKDRRARTVEEAREYASAMSSAQIADYLRGKSAREILSQYGPASMGMVDNPALLRDGTVLPAEGYDVLRSGRYPNKVPTIIGSNREEVKIFLLGGQIPWRSAFYQAAATYASERWKAVGVDEVARLLSANRDQPPVYAYEFAWGAPDEKGRSTLPGTWGRRLGAFHSLDIPFFLGTDTVEGVLQWFLFTSRNAPGRKQLSSRMMDYVAQFARTGDPNRPDSGAPVWKPWTNAVGGPKRIVFDATDEQAVVAMSDRELSVESVLARASAELSEPVRSQTLEYLAQSRFPALAVH